MKQIILLLALTLLAFNSVASEIECSSLTKDFDYYSQEEQYDHAKACRAEYVLKMKAAIKLVKKNKKTACEFSALKYEVDQFQSYVLTKLPTKKLSNDKIEDMKDFYLELYGDDQATEDCNSEQTAELFFGGYILQNTTLLKEAQV
jgi:hypothetical protein